MDLRRQLENYSEYNKLKKIIGYSFALLSFVSLIGFQFILSILVVWVVAVWIFAKEIKSKFDCPNCSADYCGANVVSIINPLKDFPRTCKKCNYNIEAYTSEKLIEKFKSLDKNFLKGDQKVLLLFWNKSKETQIKGWNKKVTILSISLSFGLFSSFYLLTREHLFLSVFIVIITFLGVIYFFKDLGEIKCPQCGYGLRSFLRSKQRSEGVAYFPHQSHRLGIEKIFNIVENNIDKCPKCEFPILVTKKSNEGKRSKIGVYDF